MFEDENFDCLMKIKVIGVGGGGINAVNHMISKKLVGVEFMAVDTNEKALSNSQATTHIKIDEKAIPEFRAEIIKSLESIDMIFIVAGIGGKTATKFAPIIAECAREIGVLTVAVVNSPFDFENPKRSVNLGIKKLLRAVDTLIEIPNDATFFLMNKKSMLLSDMIKLVDDILYKIVQGIANLIVMPSHIGIDFADVSSFLRNSGRAFIGIGEATGENAALKATQAAINSPLLEDSLKDAYAVIGSFMSKNCSLDEMKDAITLVENTVNDDANILWSLPEDESLGDIFRVVIVATHFDGKFNYLEEMPLKPEDIKTDGEKLTAPPKFELPNWMK